LIRTHAVTFGLDDGELFLYSFLTVFQRALLPMDAKRKGLFFVLVSAFLFLCLACLEIPEMSTLTDDVSNDFTILTHGSSASEIIVCSEQAEAKPQQLVTPQPREPAFRTIALPQSQVGSRDLLALHSIRRT
jgi:hypothetical protein